MKGKTISRGKYSKDGDVTTRGMGHIFKGILDEKKITVPQFAIMLAESKYEFVISEHMLYKILEDKVNFRADYLGMFIEVARVSPDDITKRLVAYSMESRDTGDLHSRKTYYPRKKQSTQTPT